MCATAECPSICLESEYPLSEASNKWQPQGANVLLVSLTKWEVPHLADFGKLSHSSDEAKAGWKKNSVDNSGQEQEGFLFSETYRPLSGPTYPLSKWVPRVFSQGVKFSTDLHVLPRIRMGGMKPLLTHIPSRHVDGQLYPYLDWFFSARSHFHAADVLTLWHMQFVYLQIMPLY